MKKKGFMRKRSFGFMAFVLLLTVIMSGFHFMGISASEVPEGATGSKEIKDVFSNLKIKMKSGRPSENGASPQIEQWEQITIEADFALPDNQVEEGDFSKIEIPASMYIEGITEIQDENKQTVAKVTVNNRNTTGEDKSKPKELILTYTDYVKKHSNVKGTMYFRIRVDHTIEETAKEIPVEIKIGTLATYRLNLQYQGYGVPTPIVLGKSGWYFNDKTKSEEEKKQSGTLQYRIQINQDKRKISEAKIVDELKTQAVMIREGSVKVRKGTWKVDRGSYQLIPSTDVTGTLNIQYRDDKRGFSIDLGDIEETDGYEINYFVDTTYQAQDGEPFENDAILTGKDVVVEKRPTKIHYIVGGGKAEGSIFKIKIVKKDEEDGTKVLQDAEFDVIRKRNDVVVGTITTGGDGIAEVGGLLRDTYIIKETKAPEGYELGRDEMEVDSTKFDETTKIAEVVITNKKKAPSVILVPQIEKISIPVTIVWVGGEEAKANVSLKVGEETKEVKEFSKDKENWTGKFEELNQENDLGEKIPYTVTQEDVIGYTTEVKRNDEADITKGFTIINTKKVPSDPNYFSWVDEKNDTPMIEEEVVKTQGAEPAVVEETKTPSSEPAVENKVVTFAANYIPEMVEEREEESRKPVYAEIAETEIPKSPVENYEVKEEDLDILGDETPRGDADVDEVKSPKGKAMLAKTGGLKTYFVPAMAVIALLIATFIGIEIYRKKNIETKENESTTYQSILDAA